MNRPSRGFVLLVVLAAAAVLSLIAAFVYTRTEDQLLLSIAARGQSVASSRATLAAERKLAIYRAAYPTTLSALAAVNSYGQALNPQLPLPPIPQVGDRELTNYPNIPFADGGGAVWCVETWKMDRGVGVPPWTVIEAFGFYGRSPAGGFNGCQPAGAGNDRLMSSHVTVYLESPTNNGVQCPECGGGLGTGTVGGS